MYAVQIYSLTYIENNHYPEVNNLKTTLTNLYHSVLQQNSSLFQSSSEFKDPSIKINDEIFLFLTVGDNISRSFVIKSSGKTNDEAFTQLIKNYILLKPKDFVPIHIKIDFIIEFSEDEGASFSLNKNISYSTGIEGFAFDKDLELAFLPQEVIGYDIVQQNKINIDNIQKSLKNQLTYTDHFHPKLLKKLYKFKTKAYYLSGDNFYELYRGHRIIKKLSKEQLLQAINLSKDYYYKNSINNKGKFIYSYFPATNTVEKKYNILRHCGTAYSILETYEITNDEELLQKAKKTINYLTKKIETVNINGKEAKVVVERDVVKLGGNALAILFLAKYTQITGDQKHVELMQALATWIQEVQLDNGDFKIHKQIYSSKEITDFRSNFYTGEAIFSLVRLYHQDNIEKWLDVAEKAADYLIKIKNKGATVETVEQDHWLLYGLNSLYRERDKKLYINHAFLIAKSILKTQLIGKEYHDEFIGGFPPQSGKMPKSVPVACRSEALSNAYYLARDFGESEFASEIKQAIHHAITFQLQMQLRPESAMYFAEKKLCLGAFHNKFAKIQLRNDFTQHNISSIIAYYNILSN